MPARPASSSHYEYIADRTELPIILYNAPSRTGVSFTAETYQVLSQNPKINGVKEASGNFSLLAHTRYLCGDDFYIWSGNDDQVVPDDVSGCQGRHLRGSQHHPRGHGQR
ncbi:MAG: dihydrodipicolinate synthase family protein [Flavonifractor plautii]